jgi:hypothetical protein
MFWNLTHNRKVPKFLRNFPLSSVFRSEDGSSMFLRNDGSFVQDYTVTSQKTIFFISIFVRTTDLTVYGYLLLFYSAFPLRLCDYWDSSSGLVKLSLFEILKTGFPPRLSIIVERIKEKSGLL